MGGTTLSSGNIEIGNDSALGTGSLSMAAGTTLSFNGDYMIANDIAITGDPYFTPSSGHTDTISGVISNGSSAGTLEMNGIGTLILTGTNTYTGGTTLSFGTIKIGNDSALGTGSLSMAAGTTLSFNGDYTIANDIAITGDPYFTPPSGSTDTISGVISDGSSAGTLEMNGAGTLVLTGNDTYTGGTVISAGTLQIGAGGTSGSVTGDITDNSALVFDRSDSVTSSGTISGSGTLEQAGGGTLTLSGANAYAGGTTLSSGTIEIGNDSALGTGSLSMAAGTTLSFNGDYTIANDIAIKGDPYFTPSSGHTDTISGVISDGSSAGTLEMNGAGTLILTGTDTYTGGTVISTGTLQLGAGGTSGSVTGDIIDNSALVFDRSDSVTSSGTISGSGTLEQAGGGTLTLSGANAYAGGTTLSSGTIEIGNDSALGTGSLSMAAGTTLSFNGDYTIANDIAIKGDPYFTPSSGHTDTISGVISDGSSAGTLEMNGAGTLVLTGTNTYTGSTTISSGTLQIGNGGTTGSIIGGSTGPITSNITDNGALVFDRSDEVTYGGEISGSGSLEQAGGGKLILEGTNTYRGGTVISSGTLQVGYYGNASITGNILDDGALIFLRSGILDYGDVISGTGTLTQSEGKLVLTGANTYTGLTTVNGGTLQIGDGGKTGSIVSDIFVDRYALIFNRSNTSIYGGNITGTGSLTQAGTGTLILTGDVSTRGLATVSAGTLQIGNGGTTGAFDDGIDDFGSVVFDRSDTTTYPWSIDGTGSVTQAGTGTLVITGDLYQSGGTIISNGTLQIGSGAYTGYISGHIIDKTALVFDRIDAYTFDGTISGKGTFAQIGDGTITLTGTNTYTGGTAISAGALQLGDGGTTGSITGNVVDNAALIFDRSDNVTYSKVISGTGTLTQAGSGILILTGTDTYSGGTTISAGTLQIGHGGTKGSVIGDVTDNGALAFDRSDDVAYSDTISGTGSLTKRGDDTLTLSGANTYGGGTTLSSGTIEIGNASALGTGSLSMAAGTTLSFNGDYTISNDIAITGDPYFTPPSGSTDSISGVISNGSSAGTLEMNGAGTLVLTGTNTYTGGTVISTGTLQLGAGGTSGSVIDNITDNGAIVFDRSNDLTYSNVVSGSGSLTQQGAGKLTLTATNTYTGGTAISAGTLQLGSGGTGGSVKGDIDDNGALIFDRSDKATYSEVISGTGTLEQAGSGDLILTGTSTLTGATTVAAGTLSVNGSIASSPVTVDLGATLGGTGTVGPTTVKPGGILSPGNSIGTIHVKGNLKLNSNSLYLVEVSPSVADETLATGTANIAGKLVAEFQTGTYTAGTTYTLINSTGRRSGKFTSATTSNVPLGLTARVSYDAHDVFLTLLAGTPPPPPPPIDPNGGQIYASVRTAFIEDERLIRNAVLGHMLTPDDGVWIWGEGFAAYGKLESAGAADDLQHNHAGGIAGIDMPLGDGFRAGIAGAYTGYKITVPALASSAVGHSGHLVGYAGWSDGTYALRGGVELGWGAHDVARYVSLVSETDSGHQTGTTQQLFADAGTRIRTSGAIFEPHADLVWIRASGGAFHETGGTLSSLSGSAASISATYGILGIRALANEIELGGVSVAPRLDLGWQHTFAVVQPHQSLTINNTGVSAVIVGLPLDTNAATAQLGTDVAFTPNLKLYVGYDGLVSDRSWDNAVIARLRWDF